MFSVLRVCFFLYTQMFFVSDVSFVALGCISYQHLQYGPSS